ncbi:MAG: HupE/UreJ family protein [Sandaracinus sp.]
MRRRHHALAGTLALVAALLCASPAEAHPLGFGVLAITEREGGELDVLARVSGTEAEPGRIELAWPEGCVETVLRDAMHDEVRERRSRVRCAGSIEGRRLFVNGPTRGLELRVEVRLASAAPSEQRLATLPAEVVVGRASPRGELVAGAVRLGATHFATGIDHVLFVAAAFFLARRRGARAVALAVTAFTVGHAITLALATLGALALPTRPIEACIALSLVHVARELRVERDTLTRRSPALVCLLFGLVHGAGLASVVAGTGLRGVPLAISVGSFNVGLELAEIALVALLFAIVRARLRAPLERGVPHLVGAVGVALLLARTVT